VLVVGKPREVVVRRISGADVASVEQLADRPADRPAERAAGGVHHDVTAHPAHCLDRSANLAALLL
jgi:hypothetical protein